MTDPLVLTIAQAAERLQVSGSTLKREIRAGRLTTISIRTAVRVSPGELERYVREREQVARDAVAGMLGAVEKARSTAVGAMTFARRPSETSSGRQPSKRGSGRFSGLRLRDKD